MQAPATWSGELSERFLGGLEPVGNGLGSRTRLCAPNLSAAPCVGEPTSLLAAPGSRVNIEQASRLSRSADRSIGHSVLVEIARCGAV